MADEAKKRLIIRAANGERARERSNTAAVGTDIAIEDKTDA